LKSLKITPTSDKFEREGVWTEYGGVNIKIARSNSKAYRMEVMRLTKPYKRQLDSNDPTVNSKLEDILCRAMSHHILVDWKDFKIDNEEIEYTEQNAYSLLKNDEDCRTFITDFADQQANYYEEETEEVVGKSVISSVG